MPTIAPFHPFTPQLGQAQLRHLISSEKGIRERVAIYESLGSHIKACDVSADFYADWTQLLDVDTWKYPDLESDDFDALGRVSGIFSRFYDRSLLELGPKRKWPRAVSKGLPVEVYKGSSTPSLFAASTRDLLPKGCLIGNEDPAKLQALAQETGGPCSPSALFITST